MSEKEKTYKQNPQPMEAAALEEPDKNQLVSVRVLLEIGASFGHSRDMWNPKMKKYIYTERNGVQILDIQKIITNLTIAYNFIHELAKDEDSTFLFVGTRPYLKDYIKEQAIRCDSFYVCERWLGGTLTNFAIIRKRVLHMHKIEKLEVSQEMEKLPKKEQIKLRKTYYELKGYLSGIRKMFHLPTCIIAFDANSAAIAIKEANKMRIPVVCLVDTNEDPSPINYVIPANDDGKKSVNFFATILADAIKTARDGSEPLFAYNHTLSFATKKDTVTPETAPATGTTPTPSQPSTTPKYTGQKQYGSQKDYGSKKDGESKSGESKPRRKNYLTSKGE